VGFDFATAGRLIVGAGRAAEVPSLVAGLGSRAFVCTGSRPDRNAETIAALGPSSTVFSLAGEPTVELARQATAAARDHGTDVVVAIGGGSAIDLGKTVAVLLSNGGDPLD
jgi:alcohol dehydrogenase class IV